MNDAQYRTLFQCVKSGKCVLVVGPDMFQVEGRPLNRVMTEFLTERNPDEIDFYDFKDELFYFKGEDKLVSKNAVYYNLQEFYEGIPPGELQEQIARIPFPLIVNCAPDLMIVNAFEKHRIAHEFRFYNKTLNPDLSNNSLEGEEEDFDPLPDYPLVYNLLGHIGYEESLILSYPDLFDFLYNVFGRNNLPQSLRNVLEIQEGEERKNYLFLGFQFNKWYLQMILRLLNTQAGMQRFVLGEGLSALENTMATTGADRGFFYMKNYFSLKTFDFSPADILQQLYADCEKENVLRQPGTLDQLKARPLSENKPLSLQLEQMVANNKITPVLQEMNHFFKTRGQTQLADDTLLLTSRYNDLLQLERQGSLYVSERWVQKSKITNALMDYIEEIRKLENTTAP